MNHKVIIIAMLSSVVVQLEASWFGNRYYDYDYSYDYEDYFDNYYDYDYEDYFDNDYNYDYYFYGNSFGNYIKGKTLDGMWQKAPMDTLLTPTELKDFQLGLLHTENIGEKLVDLGCDGNYLDRTYVNIANTDQMEFEVYCDSTYHWVLMDGMPPRNVEVFGFDPIFY